MVCMRQKTRSGQRRFFSKKLSPCTVSYRRSQIKLVVRDRSQLHQYFHFLLSPCSRTLVHAAKSTQRFASLAVKWDAQIAYDAKRIYCRIVHVEWMLSSVRQIQKGAAVSHVFAKGVAERR